MELGDMFTMSKHALARALDMNVGGDQIRRCLTRPERVQQCRTRPEFDLYYFGDICCSVARESGVVATVLWATERGWRKDLKGRPGYGGRTYRDVSA